MTYYLISKKGIPGVQYANRISEFPPDPMFGIKGVMTLK